jgi:26S proteasome regulatory subunit N6
MRSKNDFRILVLCKLQAFGRHVAELQCDAVVKSHFHTLQDSMLEKDLTRIIEPYSRVQLDHVAAQIDMDRARVERKLAQMILDKKITGTLDQGDGILVVYTEEPKSDTYDAAINTIHALGDVVNSLSKQMLKLK